MCFVIVIVIVMECEAFLNHHAQACKSRMEDGGSLKRIITGDWIKEVDGS